MKCWSRRAVGHLACAACLAGVAPRLARAAVNARIVVIGGGVGGATVARYLAMMDIGLDITLVEPKTSYTTCFFSNLYLAGLRSFESLNHGYDVLTQKHGIKVIHDFAAEIDPVAKRVRLRGGEQLAYDCLVVAPGISFDYGAIEGYDEAAAETHPHAWSAGPQTRLLRRQLEAMPDNGVFLIVAPPNPFRCPPGPYERASMVASAFQRHKPRAKILILDAKDNFFEQDLFQDAWNRHYPGMIEWLPGQFTGGVKAIDVNGRAVKTAGDTYKADVINVIPAQKAGQVALDAGLTDQSGWCPINQATFESRLHPGVYLVGDAADAGEMPKSAFITNSQAKVCAFAIAASLTGSDPAASRLFNTCYTFLAPKDAVADAINFKLEDGTIKIADIVLSQVGESADTRAQTVRQADDWYNAFTHDIFG